MSPIEHFPLVESERVALRRYADGLDDLAIAVLIGSAVWTIEHLEAQLAVISSALDDLEHAPFRAQALADLPDIIRDATEGQ
jgi:hypothetical protein